MVHAIILREHAGVYLLDWKLMRRILILGLALSVFAAGLMPLSACALFSSKMAECAEVKRSRPATRCTRTAREHNSPEVQINPAALPRKLHSQNCSSKGLR